MEVNQAERAYRAWLILTERARAGETITYGEIGSKLGIHHRAVRFVLALIQDHCLEEKLPPLTILIINQGGKPGDGFIAYDVDKFEEGKRLVYSFSWGAIQNPFEFASDGTTYEELVSALASNPDKASDIIRLVKVRGVAQSLFRDALLCAYQAKCAFTNISFQTTLEACHIVPWSLCQPEERLDVRNGLLLNSLHHHLFDKGLITITRDFRIWCAHSIMNNEPHAEYDRMLSSNLHGKKMRMPASAALQPSLAYLERSHKLYEWTNRLPSET